MADPERLTTGQFIFWIILCGLSGAVLVVTGLIQLAQQDGGFIQLPIGVILLVLGSWLQ